jgi:Fungal N-terminal domain of STAND proteins
VLFGNVAPEQSFLVMTDPLSVAAGIAGLIGLASELTKTCYSYYKKVENAPAGVKDVIDEIRLMRKVLSDLEDICDQRAGQIPALDHFLKDLADCENKIVDFGLKIDKDFHSPQRLAKRLEWPFRGTEVKLFLAQVQRYRATFESAKTNAILDVVLDVQSEFELEAAKQDAVRKGNDHFQNHLMIC